jgi:prophage regulatory protein
MTSVTKHTSKRPAAQAAFAKKAAELKTAADAERPQPSWLQGLAAKTPLPRVDAPDTPERERAADRAQGPPRLMSKAEVLAIVGVSFVSVWTWMRAGTFPRSRVVGGKSMWLSTEIAEWIATLPVRPLKGDKATEVA